MKKRNQKLAEKFISLIDKYQNFENLNITMLNEFINKILVHECDRKGSRDTTQEIEELCKREECKDRLHQNYLKRKINVKQKEYEECNKAKKRVEIETRKQAICTEEIARRVFIQVSSLPKFELRKGTLFYDRAEIKNL